MIHNALHILLICLEVVIFFNLMIIVHELGHFLAARWRGLVIEKFGIWFGKPIWQKKINGVVYSLGCIPAGGFVALPQLAPMEVMEGKVETPREQLPPISALDKIIVAFAGPLFSFLLACLFAVIVWQVGRPVGEAEATTTIGVVIPGSPSEKAGLLAGDKILEIDGKAVTRWQGMSEDAVTWRIVRSEGDTIPIKVQRGSEVLTLNPTPKIPDTKVWNRRGLRQIAILPVETPMVAKVAKESAEEKAGFKANDLLTEVNGQRLFSPLGIAEFAKAHPSEPIVLTVKRGDETVKLPFAPRGAKIDEVIRDSPAAAAGLKPGDRVVGVDGKEFGSREEITEYIHSHGGGPLTFAVETGTARREVKVTPQIPEPDKNGSDAEAAKTPRIGVLWDPFDLGGITLDQYGEFHIIHPGPVEQVRAGLLSIFNTVGAIASKKSDVKLQHMGGPVAMMRIYYIMFESPQGWRLALWFSVLLNVNLALLNMLPIPVLDGGHITLAVVEAIRRRPVNVRILEYVQTGCAMLIIGFMLYIAFFDVQELPWFNGKKDAMKFKSATPTETK